MQFLSPLKLFHQRYRIGFRHGELHTMARRDIERKHLGIDFRRADGLMTHQALQYFQGYAGVQHVHRVAVSERMRGHRYRERHPVICGSSNRFGKPGRTVRSVISQRRAFSVLPVRLLRRSSGIFSVATIISSWPT